MSILVLNHISKFYGKGDSRVAALRDISFSVDEGEYVAIMGESGAGKSTLLNVIATLETATGGEIRLNGRDLSQLREKEKAAFRRQHLGFVFQNFNLLDTFNNRDNIFLPLVLNKVPHQEMERRLEPLARDLEIDSLLDRYPYEISGGQKQRVAAARALITNPDLLLADEPTGALDSQNTKRLLALFDSVNSQGQTILMVTHSPQAASYAGRTLFIKDGVIYHELYRGDMDRREYARKISDSMSVLTAE